MRFGIKEILAILICLLLLAALMLPAVRSAREAARRNSCVCHGKQLGLAVHNHHDVFKRFPNSTSTRLRGVRPGCTGPVNDAPSAGYGWQVRILPYLEETALYDAISRQSEQFTRPAFDPAVYRSALTVSIHDQRSTGCFRCPSFSGPIFSTAPEYATLPGVEISNYVAISATDLARVMNEQDGEQGANGCLVPEGQTVTFHDVSDGTSKTIFWTESRETNYASWYDGTVNWVVGADPSGPPPKLSSAGILVAEGSTALSIGPAKNSRGYLPSTVHGSIAQDWSWGPSSEHSGGVVIHGVADGAVRAITNEIDPTLYLQLITRAGREPANLPE